MLPTDLPRDLPSFLARFGGDDRCRAYLSQARWPAGFRCAGCGHDRAWAHRARLIYECAACGRQHSLLAGTIFEQTQTGLATWFLAIALVTSSKGGISAMELQRQIGFGSYHLDEFVFRFNRRTASSLSHRFARVIEHAVQIGPTPYRALVAPAA